MKLNDLHWDVVIAAGLDLDLSRARYSQDNKRPNREVEEEEHRRPDRPAGHRRPDHPAGTVYFGHMTRLNISLITSHLVTTRVSALPRDAWSHHHSHRGGGPTCWFVRTGRRYTASIVWPTTHRFRVEMPVATAGGTPV